MKKDEENSVFLETPECLIISYHIISSFLIHHPKIENTSPFVSWPLAAVLLSSTLQGASFCQVMAFFVEQCMKNMHIAWSSVSSVFFARRAE